MELSIFRFATRRDEKKKSREEQGEKEGGERGGEVGRRATGKLIAARSIWHWCFAAEQSHESPLSGRRRWLEGEAKRGREEDRERERETVCLSGF